MKNIIYVENQTFVTANNHSVIFRNVITKDEKFIPFDDIEVIVFDNQNSYFSAKIINKCEAKQIGLLFCDEKHVPISSIYSKYNYSKKYKRLKSQIVLPKKIKDRLWKKIVKTKISNQALCIKYIKKDPLIANELLDLAKQVEPMDRTYREAYAARLYFKSLFDETFKRGRYNDIVNSGLNYTYAIIRALIRKELCAHGFEPSLGINHQSMENPFNLSDDLMEPFRPFVDSFVYEEVFKHNKLQMTREIKKNLLLVLSERCVINEKIHYIADAIKITVQSLIPCVEKQRVGHLKLPQFIEGGA